MPNNFDRKKPKISIVIPAWFSRAKNSGKYGEFEVNWMATECLDRLLDVIKDKRDDYEVILIDNGSDVTKSDISHSVRVTKKFAGMKSTMGVELDPEYLCSYYDPERYWEKADVLIKNPKNLGYAPAINQGVALARGEYVCLLNNDILVWPGVFEALLAVLEAPLDPKPGMAMPALVKETKDPREALLIEKPNLTQNAGIFGPHAEFGSMIMMRRSLAREIGSRFRDDATEFMDSAYKMGFGEDRQAYAECRLLGYETYRSHDTRVFHLGNLTVSKVDDRKQYTEPNREYLKKKKEEYGITE